MKARHPSLSPQSTQEPVNTILHTPSRCTHNHRERAQREKMGGAEDVSFESHQLQWERRTKLFDVAHENHLSGSKSCLVGGLGARDGSGLASKDPGVEGTSLLGSGAAAAEDVHAAVEAAARVGNTEGVLDVRALATGTADVAETAAEARVADLLLVSTGEAGAADSGHAAGAAVAEATACLENWQSEGQVKCK